MDKERIKERLIENHESFTNYMSSLSEGDFMYAPNGKWTAGQQLEHIIRGVKPVKTALSLPKFLPKLIFGKTDRHSAEYDAIVAKYQGRLAKGGRATGRFIPPAVKFSDREPMVKRLENLIKGLTSKIDSFSENDLDRIQLPHPILGKLTTRETLYFTIYHCKHHHDSVVRNLERTESFGAET